VKLQHMADGVDAMARAGDMMMMMMKLRHSCRAAAAQDAGLPACPTPPSQLQMLASLITSAPMLTYP
jgi:hypothetical protein